MGKCWLLRRTKSDEDRSFIYTDYTAYWALTMKGLPVRFERNVILRLLENIQRFLPGEQSVPEISFLPCWTNEKLRKTLSFPISSVSKIFGPEGTQNWSPESLISFINSVLFKYFWELLLSAISSWPSIRFSSNEPATSSRLFGFFSSQIG